jgi:hypothetical protein
MPLESQKTPPADAPPPDPFAWEPDPMVVVSRRNRSIMFPTALLRGPMSVDDIKRYLEPPRDVNAVGNRDEKMLSLHAGVNFIGCRTSTWLLRSADGRGAPVGPPPDDKCALLWPYTNGHNIVSDSRSGNVDRETGRLRPDRVREAVLRVVEFSRAHRHPTDDDLWTAADGFDAPELQLLRISDIFRQRGQEAAHAHASVLAAIPYLRRTPDVIAVLGALHDYAVRDRAGAGIVAACRTWWAKKKLG